MKSLCALFLITGLFSCVLSEEPKSCVKNLGLTQSMCIDYSGKDWSPSDAELQCTAGGVDAHFQFSKCDQSIEPRESGVCVFNPSLGNEKVVYYKGTNLISAKEHCYSKAYTNSVFLESL